LTTLERLRAELEAKSQSVPALLLARVRFNQGVLLLEWGDVTRAHTLIEPAIGVMRTGWTGQPWAMQLTSNVWGFLEMHRGEHRHAEALFREAMEWRERARRGESGGGQVDLARNFGMQGRFAEAEAALVAAANDASRAESKSRPNDGSIALVRAQLALNRGSAAAALALIPEQPPDADIDDYEDPHLLRGAALCDIGQARQGLPMVEEQLSVLAREFYVHDPRLARWRALAGLCAWRAGDRRRATQLLDSSGAAFTAQPDVSPYYKAPHLQLAARLGRPAAGAR
jgi:tetratricopeptide (TPR) repeat protein